MGGRGSGPSIVSFLSAGGRTRAPMQVATRERAGYRKKAEGLGSDGAGKSRSLLAGFESLA